MGSGTLVIVKVKEALVLFELSFNRIVKLFVPSAPEVSKLIMAFPELPIVPTFLPLIYILLPISPLISTRTFSSEVVAGGCIVNIGFTGLIMSGSSLVIKIGNRIESREIKTISFLVVSDCAKRVFVKSRKNIIFVILRDTRYILESFFNDNKVKGIKSV